MATKLFTDYTAATSTAATDVILIHDGSGVKKITRATFLPEFYGKKVIAATSRWLRFNPSNKKGLVIKAGTALVKANGEIAYYATDTAIDLSSQVSTAGAVYYLYLNDDGTFTASTTEQDTGAKIGRFHTLCHAAGTLTMTAPAAPSSGLSVGDNYLVKSYNSERDSDFYDFYNKEITAVTAQTYYDVITCEHPLSGFSAGDILPESVFCLTFYADTLYDDAMVYDKDTDRMIDVYLQSGKGHSTRSAYGATHTVSRQQPNHASDMRMVGKKLLSDAEFTSAAIGSNEATSISGSSDKTTVGGHSDTNGRRMISAIGCEEMCGYLWQWLDQAVDTNQTNGWVADYDGHGSFGQEYWTRYLPIAGGSWGHGAYCGSRTRRSNNLGSSVDTHIGGRGSSHAIRCA